MKRIIAVAGAALIAGGVGAGFTSAFASEGPAGATLTATADPGAPPALRPGRAALSEGLYGEMVSRDDSGAITTHNWQNGEVTAVSASSLTVRSANGRSWTWRLTGDTEVRKDGETGKVSDIATGDKVRVFGQRDGATRTATGVIDPPRDLAKIRERLKDLPRDQFPRFRGDLPRG
jgi:hypothetical protein